MTENTNKTQKEEPDLYKRSIKGGFWVFAIRLATQLLGFIKSIIVFNFLFTENLELIIVANMLMALLTTFSESGFHAALVQKKENIKDYLDTAWVISILRGLLLFMMMFLLAPLFVSWKVAPEEAALATSIIRAMALCFLIRAFQNIGIVYFQKEMQFHKTFWLSMAGTITDIVLSILFIVVYRSVWGYVAARLAASVVNLAMSYLLCSYRPKFHFVPEKARQLWQFGKWLFGVNIIGYILNEGDDWFVWFFFADPAPLKLYKYAYRFSNMPATHITNTISQVSFPAYAKIQDDIPRLRQAYLKVLQVTAMISMPVAFIIFVLGPDFVKLFLVPESHGMIPVIQILAFYGLMKSLGSTRGPLFNALGKPNVAFHLHWMRIGLMAVLIYPLTKLYGISGTAIATLLVGLAINPMGFHLACRLIKCSLYTMIKPLFFPLLASILTGLILFLNKNLFSFNQENPYIPYIFFFLQLIVAMIVYVGFMWIGDCFFNFGFRKIVGEHMRLLYNKCKGILCSNTQP